MSAIRRALVEAVGLGVDQFDCVMQTRLGRHGTALTGAGRLNLKRNEFSLSDEPIDETCACAVCRRHSRGYLRHLFKVGEPTASRLVSLHNVAWTIDLMNRIRAAIVEGSFAHDAGGDPVGLGLRSVGLPAAMHHLSLLAQDDSSSGGGAAQLLILLLIPFAMYFLLIRPQRKRMKDQAKMQSSLGVGDEVIMNSGIYGFITGEEADRFWVEIDDDVQIRVAKAAVQGKVNTSDDADADDDSDDGSDADDDSDDGADNP